MMSLPSHGVMSFDGKNIQFFESPRLKIAAQILAGMWASGHPRIVEQTAEVLGKAALNQADALIARHNKDQEEKESGE